MAARSGRRYRLVRAAVAVSALLPLVVAGLGNSEETAAPTPPAQQAASGEAGGGAVPARAESAQPAGTSTGGIAPGAVRLRLGRFDAPATDAIARTGVSEDVPLPAGFPPREAVRSLSLTREGLAPFRAVGVTWSGHAGAVSVAVRGRAGPGGWGAWQAAAPSGGFEGAGAGVRDGAQLVWLAPSDAVQVMLAGTGESAPEDVTVDLIDPREAPGDSVPVPPVTTASVDLSRVGRPPIHTRAEWGADERLMTWPPQYAPTVRALAWHERPVDGDYAEVDVPRILRALYYYDAVSRGWGDVGDNVVVDRFGRLWEGRYGGLSRAVIGAHTPGRNTGTAGIGVLGGATSGPAAEATARYVAWKLSFGPAVDPRGDAELPGAAAATAPAPVPPAARPPASTGREAAAPGPAATSTAATSTATAAAPQPGPATGPAAPPAAAQPGREEAGRATPTRRATTPPRRARPTATKPQALPTAKPTKVPVKPTAAAPAPAPKVAPPPKPPVKRKPIRGRGARPPRHVAPPPAPPRVPGITVPRVFTDDPTVATVLPAVRDRAYVLMGSWAEPTTMRRKLATWSPARATFTELGEATPALSGQPGDVPVPADYDGDGEIDMATWAPSSGTWTIRNSAGGTTEQLVLGRPGDVPVPADYDGDGRADPATWAPKTGTWHFHGAPDVAFGRQGGQPVPADYTGDGRADLAVYNKGDGIWDIQGVGRIQLGDRWNIPVPADYDGDGKVEPATFSTRTYRWFVRNRDPVRFGGPGDIPVPAQYDGDGKADFAVWHPPSRVAPTGSWEIKGVGGYPAGTAGDIPTTLG